MKHELLSKQNSEHRQKSQRKEIYPTDSPEDRGTLFKVAQVVVGKTLRQVTYKRCDPLPPTLVTAH